MTSATARSTRSSGVDGFDLVRELPLPYVEGMYREYRHSGSGALHVHIAVPDDNWTFAVAVPTLPAASDGIAHILEHVVLSGSERYPLKAPFFAMGPRSLRTFMNALTYSDRTAYPFSSRNPLDFSNLLDVYLDSVFFPRLEEDSFAREGHRLEFETVDDMTSELRIRGVVYNEMRGSMAGPETVMSVARGRALFPGTCYEFYSGGDPTDIPDLTWTGLVEFYRRHYHPSRAVFVTHGSLPVELVQARLVANVFARFGPPLPPLPPTRVARFSTPRTAEALVAPGPRGLEDGQAALAWVTSPTSDGYSMLAESVLSECLLGNAAAPLRRALIESGIGTGLADGTGLDDGRAEAVFGAGLKGIHPDRGEIVGELVLETLERVAAAGLERDAVGGAIDRVELRRRRVSHASAPPGVSVALAVCGNVLHGGDPYRMLHPVADLETLNRGALAGELEALLRERLLENPHRALLLLRPSVDAVERFDRDEARRVKALLPTLDQARRLQVRDRGLRLVERQERVEDLSCLPAVGADDVRPLPPRLLPLTGRSTGTGVSLFDQPTNGVVHATIVGDVAGLASSSAVELALHTHILTRSATAARPHVDVAARVARWTGGIGADTTVAADPVTGRLVQPWRLDGSALAGNGDQLMSLLAEIISAPVFEPVRVAEVVREMYGPLQASLSARGNVYASGLAAAAVSPLSRRRELAEGVSFVRAVADLVRTESGWDSLAARLHATHRGLLASTAWELVVAAPGGAVEGWSRLVPALPGDPVANSERAVAVPDTRSMGTAVIQPGSVAYNAVAFATPAYSHPDTPALAVLAQLVRTKYLLPELREKGSAYGGQAACDIHAGTFTMSSYRDPNITRTYEVFEKVPRRLAIDVIKDNELAGAILNVCAQLDPLREPGTEPARQAVERLTGLTIEMRQAFQDAVRGVQADDLRRVSSEYLGERRGARATVGPEAQVKAALADQPGLFEVVLEA